jgi:hypothetical protein
MFLSLASHAHRWSALLPGATSEPRMHCRCFRRRFAAIALTGLSSKRDNPYFLDAKSASLFRSLLVQHDSERAYNGGTSLVVRGDVVRGCDVCCGALVSLIKARGTLCTSLAEYRL